MILLDIEKAFDTISWEFLNIVFQKIGFPDSFIRWLNILRSRKELRCFNNGHSSEVFFPQKGVAQGCALSPIIFIFAMEMLAHAIRRNHEIKGIVSDDFEKKIALAADDTLLAIHATETVFENINRVLDKFHLVSGLKVNYDKSLVVRIGKNIDKGSLINGSNFKWLSPDDCFTYLGIKLTIMKEKHSANERNLNFPKTTHLVKDTVASLRYSNTSLGGRIIILKSLVASKFVYRFSLAPSPTRQVLKYYDHLFYDYVWDGNRHKLAKSIMEQPVSKGGFNMHNMYYQEQSLKLIWLERLIVSDINLSFWQAHIKSCLLLPLKDFIRMNIRIVTPASTGRPDLSKFIRPGHSLPTIWMDIFYIYFRWSYVSRRKISSCSYLSNMAVCFNTAFGPYDFQEMFRMFFMFKENHIVTITEFVNSTLSIKKKQRINWFAMFDQIPVAVLRALKNSIDLHPLHKLQTGSLRAREIVILFKNIKHCENDRAIEKWSRDLEVNVKDLWSTVCMKAAAFYDLKTRSFHLLFINRSYHLNTVICKYSNVSSLCTFCEIEPETYIHLFWDCTLVTQFWKVISDIYDMISDPDENPFNKANCMLSNFHSSLLILLVTTCKQHIHYSRIISGYNATVKGLLERISALRSRSFLKCKYQNRLSSHYRFWHQLSDDKIFEALLKDYG